MSRQKGSEVGLSPLHALGPCWVGPAARRVIGSPSRASAQSDTNPTQASVRPTGPTTTRRALTEHGDERERTLQVVLGATCAPAAATRASLCGGLRPDFDRERRSARRRRPHGANAASAADVHGRPTSPCEAHPLHGDATAQRAHGGGRRSD